MDFAADEILASLQAIVQQVLPADFDETVAIASTLFPISVKPSGLGCFIAPNANPVGDIKGYRMEADAQIRLSTTGTHASLDTALSRLMTAFSSLSRRQFLALGILRVGAASIDPEVRQLGQGDNATLEQKVTYRIVYEFLKIPEDSEGVIQTIPLNLEISNSPSP
jgi:hypothetical protein